MLAVARTLSGSTPAVPRYCADRLQISACHCEERSDGTIRSPAVAQSKEQRLRRIRESAYGFARSSTGLPGFPAGMRIATPRRPKVRHAPHRPKASGGATLPWGSSPRKGCPFAGPHALARNDMQKEGRVRGCKDAARKVRGNMPGVSGGKALVRNDTSPLSLRGAKRRDNPHPRREGQEKVALRANS